MFFDSNAWPPAPDGFEPKPEPRMTAAQERTVMKTIGILLVVMFLGPFAGSSVVEAVWALIRSI